MLAELWESWRTPASASARAVGLVHEQVAFGARARRQRRAWAAHRAAAHAAVLGVAAQASGDALAVVLGAGWLLDVPLEALAARFRRVVLVDAVLPRATRAVAARHRGVALVEADLTGVVEPLARGGAWDGRVPHPAPLPAVAFEADLVVSATVLSQLPVRPRAVLEAAGVAADVQDRLARALVEAHLAALVACAGVVCLLSDFEREERFKDRTGAVRYDLLYGVRPGVDGARWWWDLAPPGEEGRSVHVRHRVLGGRLVSF